MTRYLVTGGVGFIGFHVASALLHRGDEVVILDDFSDAPYPTLAKERNAADLRQAFPKVEIVRGCITDTAKVDHCLKGVGAVVHLAGLAGVRPSFRDPARYARVNVEGSAVVFEAAVRAGVRNLVCASSSSVYGNETPLPAHESAASIAPESPYAASKRSMELMFFAMSKRVPDLACTALRFFTVYGPRQRPEMAITLFARAMLADQAITVFGDGSMRRDFTHVDDITRGVLAALDKPRMGFRALNLGSGAPITLSALVDALAAAVGRQARIHQSDVPLGDVEATFADISAAAKELGWAPNVKLEPGLSSVVSWVKQAP
jgi:UDP-glucuronate 4-epimerase